MLAGTRAEAVRSAPLALALSGHGVLRPVVVHSGRQDGSVEQALAPFGLLVDAWLDIPARSADRPAELVAGLLPALDATFRRHRPAALVVQGDSPTVLAGALAAFWAGVPVVHLESGVPAHDPFTEDGTRQMVSRIAALHLTTTTDAAAALRAEGVPRQRITIIGNTAVDAARHIAARDIPARCPELALLEMEVAEAGQRLLLVGSEDYSTEDQAPARALSAVRRLVEEQDDVQVLLPVHSGPQAREHVLGMLGDLARVTITDPLGYPDLVRALRLATLVLTDSAAIREAAPAFGTPVVILGDPAQRGEAREATDGGCTWLAGSDPATVHTVATDILHGRRRMPQSGNPYGDGNAAARAVIALEDLLGIAEGHFPATVPVSER